MAAEPLDARLARLERERLDADAAYNAALTALDRAAGDPPAYPHAPPAYDAAALGTLGRSADILASAAPPIDRSLKGRLRGLVWRIVAPIFDRQRAFNAALVEHLQRHAAVHAETQRAVTTAIALARSEVGRVQRLHAHLIQYLQTITLYVDTKDRSIGAQAEVLNAGLDAVSRDFLKRWESLAVRDVRAGDRLTALAAEMTALRSTTAIAQQTALSLKREIERVLGAAGAAPTAGPPAPAVVEPPDLDAFTYLAFENEFRGAPEVIRARLAAYLPIFEGAADVLDIGCGRGEFLDLLRGRGVTARGIDVNAAMVEDSRARGLEATRADALAYVRGLPEASLGGLFAAQVVEHLRPAYLASLIEAAARALKPGAPLVLETINPTSWVAFFESYLRDFTHVQPWHPETLQYLLRVNGFEDARIHLSSPVPADARLRPLPQPAGADADLADAIAAANANVALLNGRLFGDQDYAVIARRP